MEITDYKLLYDKYCGILNKEEKTKNFINSKKQSSVAAPGTDLGHFFFIALLDGHPQISTLP